jgi:hypothetical protein
LFTPEQAVTPLWHNADSAGGVAPHSWLPPRILQSGATSRSQRTFPSVSLFSAQPSICHTQDINAATYTPHAQVVYIHQIAQRFGKSTAQPIVPEIPARATKSPRAVETAARQDKLWPARKRVLSMREDAQV